MHVAAERGQVDIMKMLTNVDPVLVNSVDNQGCTPLHLAAQEGLTDSVRFLIDWGVDVNIRDKVVE